SEEGLPNPALGSFPEVARRGPPAHVHRTPLFVGHDLTVRVCCNCVCTIRVPECISGIWTKARGDDLRPAEGDLLTGLNCSIHECSFDGSAVLGEARGNTGRRTARCGDLVRIDDVVEPFA